MYDELKECFTLIQRGVDPRSLPPHASASAPSSFQPLPFGGYAQPPPLPLAMNMLNPFGKRARKKKKKKKKLVKIKKELSEEDDDSFSASSDSINGD
jgi:hypothetical protein